MALGRPGNCQRTPNLEPLSRIVDTVNFLCVGEPPGLFVQDHRAVFPRVPKLSRGLHELISHVVSVVVLQEFLHTEILGF